MKKKFLKDYSQPLATMIQVQISIVAEYTTTSTRNLALEELQTYIKEKLFRQYHQQKGVTTPIARYQLVPLLYFCFSLKL